MADDHRGFLDRVLGMVPDDPQPLKHIILKMKFKVIFTRTAADIAGFLIYVIISIS